MFLNKLDDELSCNKERHTHLYLVASWHFYRLNSSNVYSTRPCPCYQDIRFCIYMKLNSSGSVALSVILVILWCATFQKTPAKESHNYKMTIKPSVIVIPTFRGVAVALSSIKKWAKIISQDERQNCSIHLCQPTFTTKNTLYEFKYLKYFLYIKSIYILIILFNNLYTFIELQEPQFFSRYLGHGNK